MFPAPKIGVSGKPHYHHVFRVTVGMVIRSKDGGPLEPSEKGGILIDTVEPLLIFLCLVGFDMGSDYSSEGLRALSSIAR